MGLQQIATASLQRLESSLKDRIAKMGTKASPEDRASLDEVERELRSRNAPRAEIRQTRPCGKLPIPVNA